MKAKQGLTIAAVILGLLLLLSGWWGLQQRKEKTNLQAQNEQMTAQLSDLEGLKGELEQEIDSWRHKYEIEAKKAIELA